MLTDEYFKKQFNELYKQHVLPESPLMAKICYYFCPVDIIPAAMKLRYLYKKYFFGVYTNLDGLWWMRGFNDDQCDNEYFRDEDVKDIALNYWVGPDFAEDLYRLHKAFHNEKLKFKDQDIDMYKLYTTNLNIFERIKYIDEIRKFKSYETLMKNE